MKFVSIFKNIVEQEQVIDTEPDMEKILSRSKKVRSVLIKLLTSQDKDSEKGLKELRNIITDIKCLAYKPSTFRIVFRNGSWFDLRYDPVPLQQIYPEDFKSEDAFTVLIAGKKYNIANRSELQQAMDYLNIAMKTQPVGQGKQDGEEAPDETSDDTGEDTDKEETAEDDEDK